MAYANRAPRLVTILVAIILGIVAGLAMFSGFFSVSVGAWLAVAAAVIMLLGVFIPGL